MKWRARWYFIKPWKKVFSNLFSTWEKCVSLNYSYFCRTTHMSTNNNTVSWILKLFSIFYLCNIKVVHNSCEGTLSLLTFLADRRLRHSNWSQVSIPISMSLSLFWVSVWAMVLFWDWLLSPSGYMIVSITMTMNEYECECELQYVPNWLMKISKYEHDVSKSLIPNPSDSMSVNMT